MYEDNNIFNVLLVLQKFFFLLENIAGINYYAAYFYVVSCIQLATN